jgi:hypothetical protein
MGRRACVVVPVLVALARPAAADVQVQVAGPHVELVATAAPLAEVLDRLSRQTGMKIVYEGPAPRQLVTLSLRGRTPAQTVLAVLEGQGVNFAMVTDPSGANARTLLVAGTTPTPSAGTSVPARTVAPPPARHLPFGVPGASPLSEPTFEESEEEEPPTFGLPPGVEGISTAPQAESPAVPPGQAAPSVPAVQGPIAPPQQFPVSPFAPLPPVPVPQPAAPAPNGQASPANAQPPEQ